MKAFVVGVLELFAWLFFFAIMAGFAGAGYLFGRDQSSEPFGGFALGLFAGVVIASVTTGTLFLLLTMRDLLAEIAARLDELAKKSG